jgi:hypothetical protein
LGIVGLRRFAFTSAESAASCSWLTAKGMHKFPKEAIQEQSDSTEGTIAEDRMEWGDVSLRAMKFVNSS